MVKTLRLLLLSLLWLSSLSNAQNNSCYCIPNSYHQGTGVYSNTTVCTANTSCWACQPGAYPATWQQNFCSGYTAPQPVVNVETQTLSCPTNYTGSITQTRNIVNGVAGAWTTTSNTCQPTITTETQTLNCPPHYSGSIVQTRTITAGVPGYWATVSNTCRQDPPTCQVSTQTQTLSCATGYTGNITQVKTSTCPDPYGTPLWGAWTTSSDTCVKSVTNPTNISSPVSPISPVNPSSVVSQTATAVTTPTTQSTTTTSVTATPTGSATATDQTSVPTSAPTTTTSTTSSTTATTVAPAASSASSPVQTQPTVPAPKGKMNVPGLGTVIALDTFVKPGIKQPDLFVTLNLSQEFPKDLLIQQQTFMEMLQQQLPDQNNKFNLLKDNTLEIEQ